MPTLAAATTTPRRAAAAAATSTTSSPQRTSISHHDDQDDEDDNKRKQDESDGLLMRGMNITSSPARTLRTRRRLWLLKFVVALSALLALYQLLWQYWLAGYNIPDVEIDPVTGRKRHRRHSDRLKKYDPVSDSHVPTEPFDGVMEGLLTLVSIDIPKQGLIHRSTNDADTTSSTMTTTTTTTTTTAGTTTTSTSTYKDVVATFCHIAWDKQQQPNNPSKVPMFKDLKRHSPLCQGTTFKVPDFYTLVRRAHAYDNDDSTSSTSTSSFAATTPRKNVVVPIPPTAVIFHESRCGSTLVSNVLAATSKPGHTVRVYSEAQPPIQALMACENTLASNSNITTTTSKWGARTTSRRRCDDGAQEQLIRDVFYMMGRMTARVRRPQFVFYKIQSAGTRAIAAFRKAMPHVPWMFLYRNPVEVVMSHLKEDLSALHDDDTHLPMCLRTYKDDWQPPALVNLVKARGRTMESLSKEEYCAANIATFGQAAIEAHAQQQEENVKTNPDLHRQQHHQDGGPAIPDSWFVDYKELPFVLWERVIPDLRYMGTPSADDIARLQSTVTSVYSKGRGGVQEEQRHWKEDSLVKQSRAPESVKRAVQLFLDPVHKQLELIRLQQEQQQQHHHQ